MHKLNGNVWKSSDYWISASVWLIGIESTDVTPLYNHVTELK